MIQQNKKGFSLVEVMLLFTVLAVVLTAAIPIISRKSAPIPNKVNHGVYRCIQTPNGMLEELYTGSRQVKSDSVNRCTFNVPKAALYRVDLYSAGAGGTKGAKITAALDDFRSETFTSKGEYSNGGNNLVRELTAEEILGLFKGENLIKSVYSKDAGSGGNVHIERYAAPYKSRCIDSYSAIFEQAKRTQEKKDIYDPIKTEYETRAKQKSSAYDDYTNAQKTVESYEKMVPALETLLSAINSNDNEAIISACGDAGYSCADDMTQDEVTSLLNDVEADLESTRDNLASAKIEESEASAAYDDASTALDEYRSIYNEAKKAYEDQKAIYDVVAVSHIDPVLEDYLKDTVDDKPNEAGGVFAQVEDYCRTRYENLVSKSETDWSVQGFDNEYKSGAEGGKGAYIRVKFPFTFHPSSIGKNLDNIKKYLKNLQTPGEPESFYVTSCADYSNKSRKGSDCVMGTTDGSLDGLTQKNIIYETEKGNVGKSGDASARFTFDDPNRTANTTKGRNLEKSDSYARPYPAWHLPHYSSGGVPIILTDNNFTMLKKKPTGGERAEWTVDESTGAKGEYETPEELEELRDRIAKGENVPNKDIANVIFGEGAYNAHKIITNKPNKGDDAGFHTQYFYRVYSDLPNVRAKIDTIKAEKSSESNPIEKDLKVKIESSLWSKTYEIGMGGSAGKYQSILTPNLGKRCEFTVPAGGRVFDWNSEEDISELEANLALTMACYNKDNSVAFTKTLNGGKYDITLRAPDDNNKFNWYKDVTNFTYGPFGGEKPPVWRPTSIWARAFSRFMGGFNAYDLNAYGIGKGGEGTKVVDSCVEPKGFYETYKVYMLTYGDKLDKYEISQQRTEPVYFPGDKNGEDCYGDPSEGETTNFYLVSDDDTNISVSAEPGGGGAVVITW